MRSFIVLPINFLGENIYLNRAACNHRSAQSDEQASFPVMRETNVPFLRGVAVILRRIAESTRFFVLDGEIEAGALPVTEQDFAVLASFLEAVSSRRRRHPATTPLPGAHEPSTILKAELKAGGSGLRVLKPLVPGGIVTPSLPSQRFGKVFPANVKRLEGAASPSLEYDSIE